MFASTASAFQFVQGDLYSSNYFSTTISHYTTNGAYIDSYALPSGFFGTDARGLAFGPDGRLYLVIITDADFEVVALDSAGVVRATYSGVSSGSTRFSDNVSYGKIAFGQNGQFFVAGGNNVIAFTTDSPTGSIIYTNNQGVFDVKPLLSGNLLVLSGYQLQEITIAGTVVRAIVPDTIGNFVDAQGVEYDPVTNDVYVTMLGFTGHFFQLMRLDANTGHVKKSVSFDYGSDMVLTSDRHLVVGSRTQNPAIFDLDLNQIGALTNGPQLFVAQMPSPVSTSFTAPSATGPGTITASFTGGGPGCTFVTPQFIGPPPGALPVPPFAPAPDILFPQGLFDFRVTGCAAGSTLTFAITYPRSIAGASYWKYGPTTTNTTPHWYVLPATIIGTTATFTITDGGLGDDDLTGNGTIVDQGGPGFGSTSIPALSYWMIALLGLALVLIGYRRLR